MKGFGDLGNLDFQKGFLDRVTKGILIRLLGLVLDMCNSCRFEREADLCCAVFLSVF